MEENKKEKELSQKKDDKIILFLALFVPLIVGLVLGWLFFDVFVGDNDNKSKDNQENKEQSIENKNEVIDDNR